MESPELNGLDLDEAEAEIRRRWFVWTAAGLTVHPVTWIDQNGAWPTPEGGGPDGTAPRSMGLRVSRPSAQVDIVVERDGWSEVAVLRPGADAVIRATTHVESAAAFAALAERAVELITWGGVPASDGPAASSARPPERGGRWVVGYDGEGWSNES